MPLLDLEPVRQRDAFSCGAAVFACVTHYWEGKGRRIKADPWTGVHPEDLEPHFRRVGYMTFSGSLTVEHLRAVTACGTPVACLIQSEGAGHWVVVRGVLRSRVHVMDPDEGFRTILIDEWDVMWIDNDRRGTVFRRHGLAVWC